MFNVLAIRAKANPNHSEIPRHLAKCLKQKVKPLRASEDPENAKGAATLKN